MITISWSLDTFAQKVIIAKLANGGEEIELRAEVDGREFTLKQNENIVIYTKLITKSWIDRIFAVAPLSCITKEGVNIGIIIDQYNFELLSKKYKLSRPNYFQGEWSSGVVDFSCSGRELKVKPLVHNHDLFFCALGVFLWMRRAQSIS